MNNLRERAESNFGVRELASAFLPLTHERIFCAAGTPAPWSFYISGSTTAVQPLWFHHPGSTTADTPPRFNHSGSTTPVAKAPPLLDRGGEISPAALLLNQEGLSASEGGGFLHPGVVSCAPGWCRGGFLRDRHSAHRPPEPWAIRGAKGSPREHRRFVLLTLAD